MPRKPETHEVVFPVTVSETTRREIKAEAALQGITAGEVVEMLWRESGRAGLATDLVDKSKKKGA